MSVISPLPCVNAAQKIFPVPTMLGFAVQNLHSYMHRGLTPLPLHLVFTLVMSLLQTAHEFGASC